MQGTARGPHPHPRRSELAIANTVSAKVEAVVF